MERRTALLGLRAASAAEERSKRSESEADQMPESGDMSVKSGGFGAFEECKKMRSQSRLADGRTAGYIFARGRNRGSLLVRMRSKRTRCG